MKLNAIPKTTCLMLAISSVAGLTACSNAALYSVGQSEQKKRCLEEELPALYDECMKAANVSYEEYTLQREKLLKEDEN